MRTLVFGAMPTGATPATHIASGPWCFTGHEAAFPGWWQTLAPWGTKQETPAAAPEAPPSGSPLAAPSSLSSGSPAAQGFPLPEDPYPSSAALLAAARAANGETRRLLTLLGDDHNAAYGVHYSQTYWEMAFGPWLLMAVHMLAERQQRMLDLIARYGNEPLIVPVLPAEASFSFSTTLDFMHNGVLNRRFNHYLFSRMLKTMAPPAWQLQPVPSPLPLHHAAGTAPSPRAHFKEYIRQWLRRMPFPRQKGFSLGQSLLLSLAVLGNDKKRPDASLDFSVYCAEPLAWHFPAEEIIRACLPRTLEPETLPRPGSHRGRLRCMTAVISQNDTYRLELAAWREGGGKLFSIQHGANYGNLLAAGGIPFEYMQHAFITWGWEANASIPANALPMPHPLLSAMYDTHQGGEPSLILVGTEMSTFTYRLKSRPLAANLVRYRTGKLAFLAALHSDILPQTQYRPYFSVPSGLDDAAFVHAHYPQLPLCQGDLTAHLLRCKLLVLDHYGTTLHTALAANVPTVAFWHQEQWGMEEATLSVLAVLRKAGMVHASAEEAAAHVNTVWNDVASWWHSPEVQAARKLWLQHYALCQQIAENRKNDSHSAAKQPPASLTMQWWKALRGL